MTDEPKVWVNGAWRPLSEVDSLAVGTAASDGRVWDGRAWLDPSTPEGKAARQRATSPTAATPLTPPVGAVWDGRQWVAPAQPVVRAPDTRTWWQRNRAGLIIIGAVLAIFVAIGISASLQPRTPRYTAADPVYVAPTIDSTAWVPIGFDVAPGLDVAWKWNKSITDCGYHDSCAAVDVVARDGCPGGVYVQMAEVDSSGTLSNPSNDIGPGLRAGERATITVGWLGSDGGKVKVTDINCLG